MADELKLDACEIVKHWLLSLAVEFPISLGMLFPMIDDEALNVKPVPDRNPEDYAKALVELFDSAMIKLSSEFAEDDVESKSGISRILDRFLRFPKEDPAVRRRRDRANRSPEYTKRVRFQLTEIGGKAWEKVAEPDWGRFVFATTTYSGVQPRSEMTGDLVSPDRDLLIANMGWYPEVRREQIKLETVRWQTHADFEILYWKRLPFVYHASFQTVPAATRWSGYGEPEWFRDWWTSTFSWHKKPWQLPSWPSE